MARMPGVPWREAASWSSGRPLGPVRFIVIHCTANSEGPTAAENGAAYDSRRTDGVSCHFMVDSDSFIQEVDTANRAHGSLYHGNAWGVQIEITGQATQTRAQWLDPVSRATIANTAKICAWINDVHNLPRTRLIGSQVRTGMGITSHGDITVGFPEDGGSHMDPGPNFPWDVLLADIDAEMGLGMVDETDATEQGIWRLLDAGLRGINETSQQQRPGGGTWSRPNNWLVRRLLELEEQGAANAASLASLHLKIDALPTTTPTPGEPADVDAIAAAVADVLAARLAE